MGDDGVEHAAACLDHFARGCVGVWACDQDGLDAEGAGDRKGLVEDLGGVSPPPLGGNDAVADVAARGRQPLVQAVPDGDGPDEFIVNLSYEERRRHPAVEKGQAATLLIEAVQIAAPRFVGAVVEEKGEVVGGNEGGVGIQGGLFIFSSQRSQSQPGRDQGCRRMALLRTKARTRG